MNQLSNKRLYNFVFFFNIKIWYLSGKTNASIRDEFPSRLCSFEKKGSLCNLLEFWDFKETCLSLTVVAVQNPRKHVVETEALEILWVLRHLEAQPATNEHRRVPVNCALFVATRQRVNTMVCVPVRAAKGSSREPCRKAQNTCV